MRRGILVLILSVVIGGCSAANAADFDPSNDIHCSALALAIRMIADQQGAPVDQKKATAFVDDWYGRKLFQLGQSQGEKKVLGEAKAIATMIEKNPMALKDEYMSCTSRAIKDAGLSS